MRRLFASILRGFAVGFVLLVPSLMLVNVSSDATYFVLISSLLMGFIVFSDYYNSYPSILEFRDAPPFNRIRFLHGILSVYCVAGVFEDFIFGSGTSNLGQFSMFLGRILDFTESPIDMLMMSIPSDLPKPVYQSIRAAGGVTLGLSLVSILAFWAYIKTTNWPVARGQFNVWVNLPMMDPTRGKDLAKRMRRRAQINIGLGMVCLFAVLILFKTVSLIFGNTLFQDLIVLIWIIILWGGIPTTMIMRGLAMARLATEIEKKQMQGATKSDLQAA